MIQEILRSSIIKYDLKKIILTVNPARNYNNKFLVTEVEYKNTIFGKCVIVCMYIFIYYY